jgi:hypothetical protein
MDSQMKDYDRVQIGDYVSANFERLPSVEGVVRYIASSAGDCWVIEGADNVIYYVQQFAYITKGKQR